MPLNKEQIRRLIESPSLGAVTYQARILIQELEHINDIEYPLQARHIRDVFLCWVDYILEQLWELYNAEDPIGVQDHTDISRVHILGRALHRLYSYIRYLLASSPDRSPPAIQLALAQLTDLYFPIEENGEPICLVRPQWTYNLRCVPLTRHLEKLIAPSVLDPNGELGIKSSDEILSTLWKKRYAKLSDEEQKNLSPEAPKQLAILSFAGLDTHDTLFYSLLAHELGHFIDFSYKIPLHNQNTIPQIVAIRQEQVREILEQTPQGGKDPKEVEDTWKALVDQTAVCLRELIADLLATRMLGFAFFAAQSEFLKTLAPWPQPPILPFGYPAGYPGIKFRLSVIFDHLVMDNYPGNIRKFLNESTNLAPDKVSLLQYYLDTWHERLSGTQTSEDSPEVDKIDPVHRQLSNLTETAVRRALPALNEIVQKVVPNEKCARLTNRFFDRIARLEQNLPPSCPDEEPNCFSEIMSASWAYQLLYGEEREIQRKKIDEQFSEYNKTCRLILKAIELIPKPQASQSASKAKTRPQSTTSKGSTKWLQQHGVLSRSLIQRRLDLPIGHPSSLVVVPYDRTLLQAASLDIRLGHWFALDRRMRIPSVKLGRRLDEQMLMTIGREEIFVPSGHHFLLHPNDFVRGTTLEFFALPGDLTASVEGRSGPGRRGLVVATAASVAPGFHGVIVLELHNDGMVPLEVEPGMSIAQLEFKTMAEHVPIDGLYHGRFYCQIKP